MSAAPHPAVRTVQTLAVLLDLARRARQATTPEALGFILVNDTHQLTPFRQGVLINDSAQVQALSGVTQPEANAPYVQWLERVARHLTRAGGGAVKDAKAAPAQTTAARAFAACDLPTELADEWADWWPTHGLCISPDSAHDDPTASSPMLLLGRDLPWTDEEQRLLNEWWSTWLHAWRVKAPGTRAGKGRWPSRLARAFAWKADLPWWKQARSLAIAAALAACFIPVRMSVLAPGELVPAHPAVVRAPVEGVIATFEVQPNTAVKAGAPLFTYDVSLMANRLAVARQSLATAEAEYRQTYQQALQDPRFKSQLAILAGKIEERRSEVSYLAGQHERSTVVAPQAGMVLMDDPSEWIGRPVNVGERVMRIAETGDREIEGWMPIGDAIALPADASVHLYLNASPLDPVPGTLRYVAHEAVQRPDGTYAYRVRAQLSGNTVHRVGLKGTMRIQGEWTPLIYWALRRPLASLRATIGY